MKVEAMEEARSALWSAPGIKRLAGLCRTSGDANLLLRDGYCLLFPFIDDGKWAAWDELSTLLAVGWDSLDAGRKAMVCIQGIGLRLREIVAPLDASGKVPLVAAGNMATGCLLLAILLHALGRRVGELAKATALVRVAGISAGGDTSAPDRELPGIVDAAVERAVTQQSAVGGGQADPNAGSAAA